jgi:ferritin-like metal-binding protein YciE
LTTRAGARFLRDGAGYKLSNAPGLEIAKMFERLNTPAEAFQRQLSSALEMEREICEMLEGSIEHAHDQAVKDAFRSHQGETRGHVDGIETVFEIFGWEIETSSCPVIRAIEKEGSSSIKKSDDAIVDSMILGGAIETEHHEIAVYDNLIIHAHALGHDDAATILERNREEDKAALEKVKELARELARPTAAHAV